jgi:hypothetical protein
MHFASSFCVGASLAADDKIAVQLSRESNIHDHPTVFGCLGEQLRIVFSVTRLLPGFNRMFGCCTGQSLRVFDGEQGGDCELSGRAPSICGGIS